MNDVREVSLKPTSPSKVFLKFKMFQIKTKFKNVKIILYLHCFRLLIAIIVIIITCVRVRATVSCEGRLRTTFGSWFSSSTMGWEGSNSSHQHHTACAFLAGLVGHVLGF